jgi:hypothetical protein
MPGSCGRLFGNIIFNLANGIQEDFPLTEFNSAHEGLSAENLEYAVNSADDVNSYKLETHESETFRKKVIVSHLFPKEGIEEFKKGTDKGIVFINVTGESIPEVQLNATIKNLLHRIHKLNNNEPLSERLKNSIGKYIERYAIMTNSLFTTSILSDPIKINEVLRHYASEEYSKLAYHSHGDYIDNSTVIEDDQVFRIEFDTMFVKNPEGRYTTLVRLSDWLNVEYDQNIHRIYSEYERGQEALFEKYCPWFLAEKGQDGSN